MNINEIAERAECPNPIHQKDDYQGYCCTCGGNGYIGKHIYEKHIDDIMSELKSAIKKHPYFPEDVIHMVSIMNEESGESIRAALNYTYEKENINEVREELIQTAAMCLRCLSDIEKYPDSYSERLVKQMINPYNELRDDHKKGV